MARRRRSSTRGGHHQRGRACGKYEAGDRDLDAEIDRQEGAPQHYPDLPGKSALIIIKTPI